MGSFGWEGLVRRLEDNRRMRCLFLVSNDWKVETEKAVLGLLFKVWMINVRSGVGPVHGSHLHSPLASTDPLPTIWWWLNHDTKGHVCQFSNKTENKRISKMPMHDYHYGEWWPLDPNMAQFNWPPYTFTKGPPGPQLIPWRQSVQILVTHNSIARVQ